MATKTPEFVKETVREKGICALEDKESGSLLFGLSGRNSRYMCSAVVQPDSEEKFGDIIAVVSHGADLVPKSKRSEVLKLMNRANNDVVLGNFQMDSDGTVCFRTSIQVPADELTQTMVMNLIVCNLVVMDHWYRLLTRLEDELSRGDISKEDLLEIHKDKIIVV